ncbi:6204_t:CDS:2 [Entrophospora sp. SA101]|nr:6202_t:CDS:2 [Entrophospora sp. SA101]CAJ0643179.1 6204_t:CDS:2 [Entrophospora sp. SA101]
MPEGGFWDKTSMAAFVCLAALEEFQRLSNITEENGENIIFREQKLGTALKRRAVAVHNAKVPRFNPNNGSDIISNFFKVKLSSI